MATLSRWEMNWLSWTPNCGAVADNADYIRLSTLDATATAYSDGQLDDYGATGLRWSPPLTLTVRARLGGSHGGGIHGTAGFGLWNDPGGARLKRLALPRAVWFFYASPPSNLALDSLVPGVGWLAMTFDASQLRTLALLPFAPLGLLLMQGAWLRRALWPIAQWALGVRQMPLQVDPSAWHTYRIEWQPRRVAFWVDDALVLETPLSPRGPLGLVLWIDNQYAIVTPRGVVRGGLLDASGEQWLDIADLHVTSG